jgi:hypothetical protein
VCGKPVFRTEVEKQFRFNPDAGPKVDYKYETAHIKFARSKPTSSVKKRLLGLKLDDENHIGVELPLRYFAKG